MNLYEYFENTEGRGVLSTADADGKVDDADEGVIAFGSPDVYAEVRVIAWLVAHGAHQLVGTIVIVLYAARW